MIIIFTFFVIIIFTFYVISVFNLKELILIFILNSFAGRSPAGQRPKDAQPGQQAATQGGIRGDRQPEEDTRRCAETDADRGRCVIL